jgi:hypothetical protein
MAKKCIVCTHPKMLIALLWFLRTVYYNYNYVLNNRTSSKPATLNLSSNSAMPPKLINNFILIGTDTVHNFLFLALEVEQNLTINSEIQTMDLPQDRS